MAHDLPPRTRDVPAPPTVPLRLARPPAAALLRSRYDVRVHGAEHVAAHGPVVLTCNHIGLYDGPLLTALAPRPVHALVKREVFEGRRGRGDAAHSRLGTAYLAMVSGAVVVPVAHLGTRRDGESVHAVPARGSRLDLVFGPALRPLQPAVPWPRRQAAVRALAEDLRSGLAAHVQDAVRRTGRPLPGLPPDVLDDTAGREGQEVGPRAEEQAL